MKKLFFLPITSVISLPMFIVITFLSGGLLLSSLAKSQNIGIGTTTPNASAKLDVTSTNSGFLPPRMTTAQRTAIASPAIGLIVYDSTNNSVWYYDKYWREIAVASTTDNNFVQQQNALASYNMFTGGSWGSVSDSSGFLYDSGGPSGNYGNNENSHFDIDAPIDGLVCRIQIISMNTEVPYDSLMISEYSGKSYTLYGNISNQVLFFPATNGISFNFKSNNVNTSSGFVIRWDYYYAPSSTTNLSSSVTGFYYLPEKIAIRGGLQLYDNWHKDSSGLYSFSYGYGTQAKGYGSLSMGRLTKANGYNSTAFGYNTIARGDFSTVLGIETTASDNFATAMGNSTTASGNRSTAMGAFTSASGSSSTTMGSNTSASGFASTAMGYATTASGDYSSAMGANTTASGFYSTAMGRYTKAKGYATAVVGMFNDSILTSDQTGYTSTTPLFVVGNGSSNTSRSNAMVVRKDGNVGIGVNPSHPLSFTSTLGNKVALWGSGTSHYGFGIQSGLLQLYTDLANSDIAFGYGSSTAFTENMRIYGNGNAWLRGTLTQNSDARLKKNISLIQNALPLLLQVSGYNYNWENEKMDDNLQSGVLAQEVQKVFPQLVKEDAEGVLSVNYNGLTPFMIQAIKEQQKQINEVKNENTALKARLEKLEQLLVTQ